MAAQIVSIVIFVTMFILIIMDKIEKHYVTLGCGALTLIAVFGIYMRDLGAMWHVINLSSIFTTEFWRTTGAESESGGIDWATILLQAQATLCLPRSRGLWQWERMLAVRRPRSELLQKSLELPLPPKLVTQLAGASIAGRWHRQP